MPTTQTAELEVFIRQKRLLSEGFFPGSHASLWRAVAAGTFPKPIKLSAGMTAWRQSDVRAWQESQTRKVGEAS
ncbi:putative phage transcriptional regulator, AlpA family [Variovorax paradoxus B4]|uniref:Putative phage transcriptional regulator, AlpA family n=1 Tax=Variovorax paradoxus B4 TaxID=1246301 RepID=T1XDY9_VARPD|nr:AlpA family phage regulatory protein [Variovorax paradoxus]AGU50365.1 putative phage transcriptional regulator, AlpA family [Variovorax paradoxus B4]